MFKNLRSSKGSAHEGDGKKLRRDKCKETNMKPKS